MHAKLVTYISQNYAGTLSSGIPYNEWFAKALAMPQEFYAVK